MRALEKLNFLISTFGRLIIALFNVRLWPPFIIYLAVMVLIIIAALSMFSSLLSGWLVPLATWIVGDAILHYPQHLVGLPYLFERLNLAPALLLESLLMATAILMFATYFTGEKVSFTTSLRNAWRHYPKLLLIWLVNFVLVYLLFEILPDLFREFVHGSPRREMALTVGMQGLSVLLTSLLIYVVPYLVIKKRSLVSCFGGSFNLFFKNFFTTYFFVFIPYLLILVLMLILQNQETIVTKFHPRLIVGLTFVYALFVTVVNFFVSGAIVRFFLEVSED